MLKVIIESPYAGGIELNVKYARACMKDCLSRGEAPIASHLIYTQQGILNDNVPEERILGIEAGLVWGELADKTVVYTDLGVSTGMQYGIGDAISKGRQVEYRQLQGFKDNPNLKGLPESSFDISELPEIETVKKAQAYFVGGWAQEETKCVASKNEISKDALLSDGWQVCEEPGFIMSKPIENRNPVNDDPLDTGIELCLHSLYNMPQFAVLMPDGSMLNFIANSMEELKAFEKSINFYDCPF